VAARPPRARLARDLSVGSSRPGEEKAARPQPRKKGNARKRAKINSRVKSDRRRPVNRQDAPAGAREATDGRAWRYASAPGKRAREGAADTEGGAISEGEAMGDRHHATLYRRPSEAFTQVLRRHRRGQGSHGGAGSRSAISHEAGRIRARTMKCAYRAKSLAGRAIGHVGTSKERRPLVVGLGEVGGVISRHRSRRTGEGALAKITLSGIGARISSAKV